MPHVGSKEDLIIARLSVGLRVVELREVDVNLMSVRASVGCDVEVEKEFRLGSSDVDSSTNLSRKFVGAVRLEDDV